MHIGGVVLTSQGQRGAPSGSNGWTEWGNHVLRELERLNDCANDLALEIGKLKVENAILKIKSGIWGAIGALIPILITYILWLLTKK